MILQRVSLFPQERFDIPDARAIEVFGANDWTYFLKGVLTAKSKIVSGFSVTNYPNIFTVPGVRLSQNDVSVLHSEATTQAQGFYVSSGTEPDYVLVLSSNNSTTTTNFVEVDFAASTGSPDTRAFWDSGANGGQGSEFTDSVDTVINLNLAINVNISGFTTGRIPLFKIITNPDGTVNTITDCRPLLFSLGTGGTSPNPGADASYPNLPDAGHARFPTPISATSATLFNNPGQGGDKNIKDLKTWMDWVMADLKEIKQVPYWYMKPQGSIALSYLNSAMTLLQGGTYSHVAGSTGHLKMTSGSVIVRMGLTNATAQPFANFNLNTNDTLFVLFSQDGSLVNYMAGQDTSNPIVPQDISILTTTSFTVPAGGNYITSGGNLVVHGANFFYTAYSTSTGLFTGVSPDPTGLVLVGDTIYQDNYSGVGYYQQAPATRLPGFKNSVSAGAERVFWLAHFDGVNTIFIRGSELVPGESAQAGELGSDQLFQYIGSTGGADNFPVYNVNSIVNGTNLTTAIKDAYKIIETPIYDEVVTDSGGTGWANGSVIYLPANSKTSTAALYTLGTDELQVFENGILIRKGYDYSESTSTSVTLLRDVYIGSYLRFRIASIGGAGASAGGGTAGLSLQGVYQNGGTITVASTQPVTINGPAGQKLLHVAGNVQIDGLLDPTGIQLTPVASTPIPMGQMGFWVDSGTSHIVFTRADSTSLLVGSILETVSGNSPNFTRTMKNTSGATIAAGTPVYLTGADQIGLAHADDPQSSRFIGFTAMTVADSAYVSVILNGVVPGVMANTGLSTNTRIWLSSTSGAFAASAPTVSGSYQIQLGIVCGDDLILQVMDFGQIA